MLLPEVTAWSVGHAAERYAHCARTMAMASDSDSDAVACEKLVAGLRALTSDLAVPGPSDFGIAHDDWFGSLELMASQAQDSGSPANNPRVPGVEDIIQLYRRIWQ